MTRIVKKYDERRIEFLEAAREFFLSIGYEKMSIQMLLEKLGVAKGTFYHYFNSKEELLNQWVKYEIGKTISQNKKIVNNPKLDALSKLNIVFQQDKGLNLHNIDMFLSFLTAFYCDDNIRFRAVLARQEALMEKDIVAKVIKQGLKEGVFNISDPIGISQKLPHIVNLFKEELGFMILKRYEGGGVSIDEVLRLVRSWRDITERILGATSGSIIFIDDNFLRAIFNHISRRET